MSFFPWSTEQPGLHLDEDITRSSNPEIQSVFDLLTFAASQTLFLFQKEKEY